MDIATLVYAAAPPVLAAWLLAVDRRARRVRIGRLAAYLIVVGLLIWGAMELIAYVAIARVLPIEVGLVLWLTIGVRLAWAHWRRLIERPGRAIIRLARWRSRRT